MKYFLLFLTLLFLGYASAQVTAGSISDVYVCDDVSNDGMETFDLIIFDQQALTNQNPSDFSVTYYDNQTDATAGTNQLPNSGYVNTTNPQIIFVRVQNNVTLNFAVTTFQIEVEQVPQPSPGQALTLCGQSNATGLLTILFDQIEAAFSSNSNNINSSYFYSAFDALNNVNAIASGSVISVSPNGSILFRRYQYQSSIAGCYEVEQISIFAIPCISSPVDLEICADSNDIGCFNLGINDSAALGFNSSNTHSVSYHTSQADADNGVSSLSDPYCLAATTQTIYIRVEEIATGNTDTTQSFQLIVNAIPDTYSFTPITGCDSDGDGWIEWESSSVLNEITNIPNNVNSFFTEYYLSQVDAENQVNPIGFLSNFVTSNNVSTVFVRTQFGQTGCNSVSPLQLTIDSNCIIIGTPDPLTGCLQTPNTVACFDLSANDGLLLANNNPADFSVSYFTSLANANAGSNPIPNPLNYCIGASQIVYGRVQENATGAYQVRPFDLIVRLSVFDFNTLNDINECDDNLDGLVTFDLTDFQGQLNSTNTFTYFTSSLDAQNGVNPIPNPTAYEIATLNGGQQVFVLETVINNCDIIYTGSIRPQANCNNAYDCSDAQSLCERIGQPFVNVFDGSNAEAGNYYPFSPSAGPRNPTWFYIPIETSGDLTLEVYQNTQPDFLGQDLDIDFAVYGPFTNPTSNCGILTQLDYVDHSFSVSMPEIAQVPNAQAGEYYLILISNFSSNSGFLKVEIGAGSTATINCDGIKMQSFLDANLNGTVDATDPTFPLGVFEWEKNNNGNVMQVVAPLGSYDIFDTNPSNTYDLAYNILPAYLANYTVAPAAYTGVNIPNNSGMVTKDFLVTPVSAYEDVVVYIVPQEQPRPGFTYTETVYYTNLGTSVVPVGQVTFDYDPSVSIVNVSDPNAVITPNTVTLAYSNLAPFTIGSFDVEMQIPVIPTVSLGDLLTNVASISPLINDLTPANNTNTSAQIIIGSYDPNDKMESRGAFIDPSTFTNEDYFFYTIRFENTGTASAINVRVEDTLDAQLDYSTIEMINSSHNYVMERMEEQVVWRFDNIMLPDSTTDPVGANGYVYFKVKPRSGWTEGTTIPNKAEIYFDFNPPIITNIFTSTFRTPLNNPDVEKVQFSLSPNPASDQITVNFNDMITEASLTLYDVRGRVTLSRKLTQDDLQIDISNLGQGIYLVKFDNGDRSYTSKLVKK